MYRLYIDTSVRNENKVYLYSRGGKLIEESISDKDVVSAIKDLLEKNKVGISKIEEFEYFRGPGSYTGLRVGCSVANTLKWLINKKDYSKLKYPDYGTEPNITPPKKKFVYKK